MEVDDEETTDPDLVLSILAPSILGSGTEEEFFKLEREEGDGDVRGKKMKRFEGFCSRILLLGG